MRRITTGASLLLLIGLLAACSDRKAANAENFGKALAAYLDRHGQQCLGLRTWPLAVRADEKAWEPGQPGRRQLLDEFVAHGLAVVTERPMGSGLAARLSMREYSLTPLGEQLRSTVPKRRHLDSATSQDFCWGHRRLAKVVKWDAPMSLGSFQGTTVSYTSRLETNASWPKVLLESAAMRTYTQRTVVTAGEAKRHGVKLTSEGWEANGMD